MFPKRTARILALAAGLVIAGPLGGQAAQKHSHGRHHLGYGYAASFEHDGGVIDPSAASRIRFVPGEGMVGVACNLPTSACPNSMRDAN